MKPLTGWALVGVVCVLLSVSLAADTVVLRDGRRVQGQLVSIRAGVVEVDVPRGFFGRDRVQVNQSDVERIEFDEIGQSFDSSSHNGGGNSAVNGPTRPAGLRERAVTVNASEAWRDSGVDVRAGQTVYFNATGKVKWGPDRQDGPQGERNSPQNDARPMPNRPAAALIGRVGNSNDFFFIGDDTGPIRVRDSGRLYLAVNDDFLQDNSGTFRVTVYY